MNLRNIFWSVLAVLCAVACSEKEDTTPSFADADRLETLVDKTIPAIGQFREQYGTYVLYHFDKTLDFAYQFEQANHWEQATLTPIDHDDAEAAMALLSQHVFSLYGDDFKARLFPRKLLLVADLVSSNELGLSVPVMGHHQAVANLNSVTFARMALDDVREAQADADLLAARVAEMHRALLADYLVRARGIYPVGDDFLAYSLADYAALMDSRRQTAAQLAATDPDFFSSHGFFPPIEDESTYFPSAEDDVIAYIRHLITMDQDEAEQLFDKPLMASKMHLMALGLQQMGVDVLGLNPNLESFLTMEAVQAAVMYANDVVTDNPKATMQVTIYKGSHELDRLEVFVNGDLQSTLSLKACDKMRNIVSVDLDNLKKGVNNVVLNLYEEGRKKASVMLQTGVSYATMDEVIGLSIKCSNDPEEVYRRLKKSLGDGGDVDKEESPDLITIAFEKHGWLDRYFMEQDAEYRYWKIYKQDGRVCTIMVYLRDGFNEDYTAPNYRHTGTYTFTYTDEGNLNEVTFVDEAGKKEVLVDNVVYVAGRMVRYAYKGIPYEPKYATVGGVTTRVDCLDETLSGRTFGFDATEDLNPYYMPELPAVLPGNVCEIPLQLLYSQYLFKSLSGVWDGGWKRNLENKTNAAEVTLGEATWTFQFKLK